MLWDYSCDRLPSNDSQGHKIPRKYSTIIVWQWKDQYLPSIFILKIELPKKCRANEPQSKQKNI